MRYFNLTITLLFFTSFLMAQTVEVHYYTPGPTQAGQQTITKAGTATLKTTPGRSLFIEHPTEDILVDDFENQNFSANIGLPTDLWLYKDFKTKELIYKTPLFNGKYVKVADEIVSIQWQLTNQQRQIGGIPCQEAIGTFRGRTYHAWFTYTIPISDGPWKLTGLPGLILEAYDEEKVVVFLFESLKKSNEPIIKPREKLKVTDYKTPYLKMLEAFKKSMKFQEAQMKKEGIEVSINFSDAQTREKITQ